MVQSPGERRDVATVHSGAISEILCCLSGGSGAEHGVGGRLEAITDRGQRRRFPGPGHAHDEIETLSTHQESDRDLLLRGGQGGTETLLEPGDSAESGLLFDLRALIAGQ